MHLLSLDPEDAVRCSACIKSDSDQLMSSNVGNATNGTCDLSSCAPDSGLVFGEVDEDVFSTPLAVTRASSRAADAPSSDGTYASPRIASPPASGTDGEASPAFTAGTFQQHLEAPSARLTEGSFPHLEPDGRNTLQQESEHEPQHLPGSDAADTTTAIADQSPPLLVSAPADGAADPAPCVDAQPVLVAPASAHVSGLLSLSELSLRTGQRHNSRSAGDQPSSPSETSVASSVTYTSTGTSGDAVMALPTAVMQQFGAGDSQAPQAPGLNGSAVAADAGAGNSTSNALDSTRAQLTCSPIATHSSTGLERAPSWQLQHAAAEAAGTATHPAPPRSDMDLAKISNTPASPHGESGWAAWQQRRRHFFVLTAAGKPVYSRHGDEQALAGFMAVIQALLSVMTDQGDVIHSITVGSSNIEFLVRGQLYLVAASSRGEAQLALRRQLELLYQAILMVATGGVERLLVRSPGYDVQQLLAGATPSLDALISGFGDCPGWMTASVEPAPMAAADRLVLTAALQNAVKACDCLYGVLVVAGRVASVERGAAAPPCNVFDLLLLVNFASSNESLRQNETFVPVCLPNFQANAFVHAYVKCLDTLPPQPVQQHQEQQQQSGSEAEHSLHLQPDRGKGTFLLLLSGSADAFHKLSAAQHSFVQAVTSGPGQGVLAKVQAAAVQPGQGRVRVEALPAPLGGSVGSTPLWHAIIRYPQRHQHITLAYPRQLMSSRSQVKQLVRSYCRLYCCAYGHLLEVNATATAAGPFGNGSSSSSSGTAAAAGVNRFQAATAAATARAHKLLWVTSQQWVTGVVVDRDVEVYVTFDPLTEKDAGLTMADTLKRLFADKARRQDLLIPGL